jgi:hypothetical protein
MNQFVRIALAFAAVVIAGSCLVAEASDELAARNEKWEERALTCIAGPYKYPAKQTGDKMQPCDDGDMTLFNGLLCAAGDRRGCAGVRDALDAASGLWHRSPRIRLIGKNDRGNADSSPDMALGIQLYLVTEKDTERALKWLNWIDSNYLCIPFRALCWIKIPKFCPTDDCVVRPQDAAVLAATVDFLQKNANLPTLPNGPLRGTLGTFSGYAAIAQDIVASATDAGYSTHLIGVSVLLLRKLGSTDPLLQTAANTIAQRNPGNAFFSWLAGAPRDQVLAETLARCPADPSNLAQPLFQWQWERDNKPDKNSGLYAWEQSSLWDCIFMSKLLAEMH